MASVAGLENPAARRLLAVTREEIGWLREDGYQEEPLRVAGAGFTVSLRGSARVWITVDLSRSQAEIFVAGGRDHPERSCVSINRILRAQGAVAPPTLCPNLASDEQLVAWLRTHLAGLRRLRTSVLAGDWSTYSEARAEEDVGAARERHQTALDRVRAAMARRREST